MPTSIGPPESTSNDEGSQATEPGNSSGRLPAAVRRRRASAGSSGSLRATNPRRPPSSRGRLAKVAGVRPYALFET